MAVIAPVYKNDYIYVPVELAAKALGGIYDKDKGTITKGLASASFAEGVTTEVSPAAPAVIGAQMYIWETDTLKPVIRQLRIY